MSITSKKNNKKLSEQEIDDIVISQSDNVSEWENPILVRKNQEASFSIPAELASRAAFFARLHRETGIEEWLVRIIQERIEIEEVAFFEAKRELIDKESD